MKEIPAEFGNMRSFEDHEIQPVLDELFADSSFRKELKEQLRGIPLWCLRLYLKRFKTIDSLQNGIAIPLINRVLKKQSNGFSFDFDSLPASCTNLLFMSNHRDIVMDSALLDRILLENGSKSVEIAIGNNLLIYPWIEKLVRLNRSFIVNRSANAQQLLESSNLLSGYIRYVIGEKNSPVWIAQREGRAKDSDDRTQKSVLKMLAMSGDGNVIQRLQALHITPLSISYEYDPCDWLKAQEFQLKRDNPDYRKSKQDDLLNMKTGIFGYKGRIHYHASAPIDNEIAMLDSSLPRNVLLDLTARIIDRHIFEGYRIYPCNRIALDLLRGNDEQASMYSLEEKANFERYMDGQLAKTDIANPDMSFLRRCFLTMYANPLINQSETVI